MNNKQLKAKFLTLYQMVIADGIIEAKELECLYRIGRERYCLTPEEINKSVLSAGSTFITPTHEDEVITILYEMAEIAWADGAINEYERSLLARYAVRFGYDSQNARAIADYMLQQIEQRTTLQEVLNQLVKN